MKRNVLAFLFIVLAQLIAVSAAQAAGRECVENFKEAGQRSGSAIEIGSDANKALISLARAISEKGFLGLSVNKDIGVVSAFQENNGKKSLISGSVTEISAGKVKVEATFVLAEGLRASRAALLENVCAMIEATMTQEERGKMVADTTDTVMLKTPGQDRKLSVQVGTLRKAGFAFVVLLYFDFPGSTAPERTKERRPVLSVPAKDDPAKSYFLVKLEQDGERQGMRSLKILSAGSLIMGAVTGKITMDPDTDWTRPIATKLDGEGRWSVTSVNALEPGEYGLWDAPNGALMAFGVD